MSYIFDQAKDMTITTTLSKYSQKDSPESDTRIDTHPVEDTQNIQITQVVSCIVRAEDRPGQQSREAREKLIRDHIAGTG